MPRDRFYNSTSWKRLRAAKLASDPLCEYCKVKPATDVDHRKAINQGGHPTEWSNLVASCHECHSRKTLYVERMGKDRVPIKGCTVDGMPLDPAHWWNEEKKLAVAEAKDRGRTFACIKF